MYYNLLFISLLQIQYYLISSCKYIAEKKIELRNCFVLLENYKNFDGDITL